MDLDIVIPLGADSVTCGFDNLEIQYSLLTLKKYLSGYRNIYIIGEHPSFDGDFIHVQADDPLWNKEANIRRKIEIACKHPDISENFLFANDDYAYMKQMGVSDFGFYYDGDLELAYRRKRRIGCYKSAIENTTNALRERGKPIKHFDIHVPIIYNKEKFLQVMSMYQWKNCKCGYLIKSLYCNSLEIEGELLCDMMIGFTLNDKAQVYDMIKNRFVFAYNECAINEVLIDVLNDIVGYNPHVVNEKKFAS